MADIVTRRGLSRRTFLRGLGTTLALPLLDALETTTVLASGARVPAKAPPLRVGFFYVPNGVHMPDWTPNREGAHFDLPSILQPLERLRRDVLVVSGLAHDKARANDDRGGDHARSASCFLTGVQPVKTAGAGVRAGLSVDQAIAQQMRGETKLPSIVLGTETTNQTGSCDTGYACPYTNNISWYSESTPVAKDIDPRVVFERLFAGENAHQWAKNQSLRHRYRRSILDFILEDARRLEPRLGSRDHNKLDEYFTAVREIERRLEVAEKSAKTSGLNPRGALPPEVRAAERPSGIPEGYNEHLRLLCDMIVLAFRGDVTRVASLMFARAGSNRSYGFIGVPEGHHHLSHHGGDVKKQQKISRINRFHVEQFAYIVSQLGTIPEGEGTLLDHSVMVYGSGISDGNRHAHHDLPVLLAGSACGTIETGRHTRCAGETPMSNLYVSLLERFGVRANAFGDSTGSLDELV